jgi:TRAP-type C4-dicarboxylate transport system permease small subunit
MSFGKFYDGNKYVKFLFGAAAQALSAFVLSSMGIIALNPGQQVINAAVTALMIFLIVLFTKYLWQMGNGMCFQCFTTAALGFLGIMRPTSLQQLVFGLIYAAAVIVMYQNAKNKVAELPMASEAAERHEDDSP